MKWIFQISLGLLLLHAFACTQPASPNHEKPEKIFADFYVRYMQGEQIILAEADFQSGDTTQRRYPKRFEKVRFQGAVMNPDIQHLKGIHYKSQQKGTFPESCTFSITNEKGLTFEYKLQMSPIDDFLIKGGKIEKSEGLSLAWQGSTLQEHESLILLFQDEQEHSLSALIKGSTLDIQFNLPSEKLNDLSPGKGQLYLVKKQERQFNRRDTTVHSIIEFYTKVMLVDIVE